MRLHLPDSLSYMIRTDGECIAFMPDDEEFSIRQLHDAVAGVPELVCFTAEGYALFRCRDAKANQLPVNQIATEIWHQAVPGQTESIVGRVFLAHPDHIPTYWRHIHKEGERIG